MHITPRVAKCPSLQSDVEEGGERQCNFIGPYAKGLNLKPTDNDALSNEPLSNLRSRRARFHLLLARNEESEYIVRVEKETIGDTIFSLKAVVFLPVILLHRYRRLLLPGNGGSVSTGFAGFHLRKSGGSYSTVLSPASSPLLEVVFSVVVVESPVVPVAICIMVSGRHGGFGDSAVVLRRRSSKR
ncbi:hypothetical protein YC2023_057066 [Brassica napus]